MLTSGVEECPTCEQVIHQGNSRNSDSVSHNERSCEFTGVHRRLQACREERKYIFAFLVAAMATVEHRKSYRQFHDWGTLWSEGQTFNSYFYIYRFYLLQLQKDACFMNFLKDFYSKTYFLTLSLHLLLKNSTFTSYHVQFNVLIWIISKKCI